MEQLQTVSGIAVPMLRINIDTDQIIPARFLVRTSESGLGEALFYNWAHMPDGTPNPDFILNREPWSQAKILLADRNFGCGSSREAAPRALRQKGFRVVIAPSFGGIFFNNCFRNGILPVELEIDKVKAVAAEIAATPDSVIVVDLERELVRTPGGAEFMFQAPRLMRRMMLEGLDEVALTLTHSGQIEGFRSRDKIKRPWAYSAQKSH
jgi:3-isopropylmalate/(R)-2-methylmalate dehydratase small subunit